MLFDYRIYPLFLTFLQGYQTRSSRYNVHPVQELSNVIVLSS